MKKVVIWLINLYKSIPFRSHSACGFLPTCSEYTKEAILKYGTIKGSFIGLKRISRCHPWSKGGYDPLK